MARVLLQNVTKRFPGVEAPAVDGVTIEARDREFLVLVGPSGCGKSTTLRMVAGLEEPTSGEVHIGGRRVDGVPPQDLDVAMIFQNYALYPHMTVYENLRFPLRMRRIARDEADRRVRRVAEMLGLTEFLNRKPRALSGGQRQRTAVGRAIVREPRVFLFDEPLSNLDAKMRLTMRKEIRRLHRQLETTMIYVTHDQTEALTMGDRIVVMNEGRVQQAASPRELYERPANRFVAGFIGSPPMNFFSGELGAAGEKLLFNAGSFELALPKAFGPRLGSRAGGPIDLGLRPEDIADEPAEGRAEIAAEVTAVEPLGSETLLYFKTGRCEFVARLGPEASATVGEKMRVYFNLAKCHFFDPESGERLD